MAANGPSIACDGLQMDASVPQVVGRSEESTPVRTKDLDSRAARINNNCSGSQTPPKLSLPSGQQDSREEEEATPNPVGNMYASMKTIVRRSEERTVKRFHDFKQTIIPFLNSIMDVLDTVDLRTSRMADDVAGMKGRSGMGAAHANVRKSIQNAVEGTDSGLRHRVEEVFSHELVNNAAATIVPDFIQSITSRADTIDTAKKCLAVIMFGLLSDMGKASFAVGVGKGHADFRFKLVRATITLAQNAAIAGSVGRTCPAKVEEGEQQKEELEQDYQWLQQGYIQKKSVRLARAHAELLRCSVPTEPLNAVEKESLYVCTVVYGIVTEFLRKARDRARSKFFQ